MNKLSTNAVSLLDSSNRKPNTKQQRIKKYLDTQETQEEFKLLDILNGLTTPRRRSAFFSSLTPRA